MLARWGIQGRVFQAERRAWARTQKPKTIISFKGLKGASVLLEYVINTYVINTCNKCNKYKLEFYTFLVIGSDWRVLSKGMTWSGLISKWFTMAACER